MGTTKQNLQFAHRKYTIRFAACFVFGLLITVLLRVIGEQLDNHTDVVPSGTQIHETLFYFLSSRRTELSRDAVYLQKMTFVYTVFFVEWEACKDFLRDIRFPSRSQIEVHVFHRKDADQNQLRTTIPDKKHYDGSSNRRQALVDHLVSERRRRFTRILCKFLRLFSIQEARCLLGLGRGSTLRRVGEDFTKRQESFRVGH